MENIYFWNLPARKKIQKHLKNENEKSGKLGMKTIKKIKTKRIATMFLMNKKAGIDAAAIRKHQRANDLPRKSARADEFSTEGLEESFLQF